MNTARADIERRITPTIRRELEPRLARLYRFARRNAGLGLADHGELEAARVLPTTCPHALDDLLADEWWPANRHGLRT